jgi:ATP/maltotriose-dependent transcriptional regulator MalT
VTDLDAARRLLARHEWEEAFALLVTRSSGGEPEWLEALAEAAWWVGRLDVCISAREAAYAAFDDAGDTRNAARCAIWLFEHYCFRAQPAIANAWLRRARRALAGDDDCVEYGNLLIREAEQAHGLGDVESATAKAEAALALGRRLRVPDVEAEALQALGRILIDRGRPQDGLAHLDEAMLFAVEGRLNPYTTGKVFCSLVSACDEIGDIQRANEWTDAVGTWAERHPVSLFPGLCRVHRAGLLQWRGAWSEAEAEARLACAELADLNIPNAAAGFVKIGEIRRRIGDYHGAEEAFRRAEESSGQAWAGLALLRLAQGRTDAAVAIINRALEEKSWNRLARGKLLPAQVQIMVAAGDLDGARAGAEELAGIAADYESPVLLAAAASARGRVALAAGECAAACADLHQALQRWSDLGVPYEIATTRLLIGQACRQTGDHDGAQDALAAAEAIFEHLGAVTDAQLTRDLRAGVELPCGLTGREAEVLRLVAGGLTNRQIATELALSDKTVARHLSNIFTKIAVRSRAAATAFAYEYGLMR